MARNNLALEDMAAVTVSDKSKFSDALAESEIKSWSYFFPYIFFMGNLKGGRRLLYEEAQGSILLYMVEQKGGSARLSLFLPPFPFGVAALRLARERMRGFNEDGKSRIIRIQEGEALLIAREGYEIKLHSEEYIYNRASVISLEGSDFASLRRKLSHYTSSETKVKSYSISDHVECHSLLDRWRDNLNNTGVKIGPYYRYSEECLKNWHLFESDALRGQVIRVDGEIAAFSFGGPITRSLGSVFITVSDHDRPGLAYFQRYLLMSEFSDLAHFNDFSDSGRPGLAQMKRTFRPVTMHGLYHARER